FRLFVSFLCSLAHRAQHSFPTRRSSDLEPQFKNASVHDPSIIKVEDTYYVFGSHLAVAKSTDLMNWDIVASGVMPENPLFSDVTDRKSTRLNSSHVKISYAVFCLKKKKQ